MVNTRSINNFGRERFYRVHLNGGVNGGAIHTINKIAILKRRLQRMGGGLLPFLKNAGRVAAGSAFDRVALTQASRYILPALDELQKINEDYNSHLGFKGRVKKYLIS